VISRLLKKSAELSLRGAAGDEAIHNSLIAQGVRLLPATRHVALAVAAEGFARNDAEMTFSTAC
jgi:hypothetical protein